MQKNNFKVLAKNWFEQAHNDYKSAKVVLVEGGYYGTTCFLAQQITEKYLKGYLISQGQVFDKVHDLVKLLNDCKKINQDFSVLEEECVLLNDYYIESRYPQDAPIDYSKKEARIALSCAERIMHFVTEEIEKL
ncbi:MAG: HEPN domain protein [Candidatus Falkowbacteria bacterium GW2011_GWC2_38_22]|uniref:HEPN domain protein n=1 Tax=Candidatus Falkowbacteria bacterium GW2011_GWE1_38_31 TaxID=1618638 RepID=A0A0G0M9M3_9BACT|nr:MAG: HEPN domain protein [Candidatus Falkowbacteria bacterium GW2011_GWF2_38_1205]KKQ61502.1 MAG: HEPN domain protein [Candidatus Falkowbacteria bacterium GW2011_GWC2_38_22]KKQ63605.1 MAG: HEPN domain protein [Candidatus Falkowbacteria bacterium GW2011_GWF1_38_22]KKQ65757.1 MAG: HEPN domain protein [Candidatus Falkowbacteria bacterium GW2011_GWE2_38_254]KKQ70374.1 MAG: HEPN domain protein [Candidatus Falkowbacteria bacterium GW2011_GWE1_38_31]KKQ72879.1 MAG: HEPN domain protein [Candidatus 